MAARAPCPYAPARMRVDPQSDPSGDQALAPCALKASLPRLDSRAALTRGTQVAHGRRTSPLSTTSISGSARGRTGRDGPRGAASPGRRDGRDFRGADCRAKAGAASAATDSSKPSSPVKPEHVRSCNLRPPSRPCMNNAVDRVEAAHPARRARRGRCRASSVSSHPAPSASGLSMTAQVGDVVQPCRQHQRKRYRPISE